MKPALPIWNPVLFSHLPLGMYNSYRLSLDKLYSLDLSNSKTYFNEAWSAGRPNIKIHTSQQKEDDGNRVEGMNSLRGPCITITTL